MWQCAPNVFDILKLVFIISTKDIYRWLPLVWFCRRHWHWVDLLCRSSTKMLSLWIQPDLRQCHLGKCRDTSSSFVSCRYYGSVKFVRYLRKLQTGHPCGYMTHRCLKLQRRKLKSSSHAYPPHQNGAWSEEVANATAASTSSCIVEELIKLRRICCGLWVFMILHPVCISGYHLCRRVLLRGSYYLTWRYLPL